MSPPEVVDLTGDDDDDEDEPVVKRARTAEPAPSTAAATAPAAPAAHGNSLLAELAAARHARAGASSQGAPKAASSGPVLSELKVLSYNLWFVPDAQEDRMAAVGDLIAKHSPHVVAFQEVTFELEQLLRRGAWWQHYSMSPSSGSSYYTLLGVRKQAGGGGVEYTRMPFGNSAMGRDLLSTEFEVGGSARVCVATSHLESFINAGRTSSKERVEQIRVATTALERHSQGMDVIFGGDMNWDDAEEGQLSGRLPGGWVDGWSVLHGESGGWTYDGVANPMLNNRIRKRLDRFVCRLHSFELARIELLGTEAVPGKTYRREWKGSVKLVPVVPSDHFGLLLTLRRKQADGGQA
jgi:tyrosyl-DNA phosphodiesterase 2